MEDNNPNFKQPYRLNEALIWVRTTKLLDVGLVKLFRGEYTRNNLVFFHYPNSLGFE